ncbi:MAG: AAA family ATPase [Candidatus Kerfeldbacteria bacterium]|nr:AAA family ATPase [Candidatus Kerfeldbacteria bacterium]
MKLIVLYGPPGVGKLTVARVLAHKTGYKVLHNHLTIELLCSLFEWGSRPYRELVRKYRFELLETAAKYKTKGVITTFVYAAEADEKEMRELLRRMKRRHVNVYFVKLQCSQAELERRIKHESRKAFTKIRHVKNLWDVMGKYDTLATIPFGKNLVIDTTNLSPQKTAAKIIRKVGI